MPTEAFFPFKEGPFYLPPVLLMVTLGNPKQECRHLGICRVEVWEGKGPIGLQGRNRCLAKFVFLDAGQLLLKCLFLEQYLAKTVRDRYFSDAFKVESPYHCPPETALHLGMRPFTILAGKYVLIQSPQGPEALFTISWNA